VGEVYVGDASGVWNYYGALTTAQDLSRSWARARKSTQLVEIVSSTIPGTAFVIQGQISAALSQLPLSQVDYPTFQNVLALNSNALDRASVPISTGLSILSLPSQFEQPLRTLEFQDDAVAATKENTPNLSVSTIMQPKVGVSEGRSKVNHSFTVQEQLTGPVPGLPLPEGILSTMTRTYQFPIDFFELCEFSGIAQLQANLLFPEGSPAWQLSCNITVEGLDISDSIVYSTQFLTRVPVGYGAISVPISGAIGASVDSSSGTFAQPHLCTSVRVTVAWTLPAGPTEYIDSGNLPVASHDLNITFGVPEENNGGVFTPMVVAVAQGLSPGSVVAVTGYSNWELQPRKELARNIPLSYSASDMKVMSYVKDLLREQQTIGLRYLWSQNDYHRFARMAHELASRSAHMPTANSFDWGSLIGAAKKAAGVLSEALPMAASLTRGAARAVGFKPLSRIAEGLDTAGHLSGYLANSQSYSSSESCGSSEDSSDEDLCLADRFQPSLLRSLAYSASEELSHSGSTTPPHPWDMEIDYQDPPPAPPNSPIYWEPYGAGFQGTAWSADTDVLSLSSFSLMSPSPSEGRVSPLLTERGSPATQERAPTLSQAYGSLTPSEVAMEEANGRLLRINLSVTPAVMFPTILTSPSVPNGPVGAALFAAVPLDRWSHVPSETAYQPGNRIAKSVRLPFKSTLLPIVAKEGDSLLLDTQGPVVAGRSSDLALHVLKDLVRRGQVGLAPIVLTGKVVDGKVESVPYMETKAALAKVNGMTIASASPSLVHGQAQVQSVPEATTLWMTAGTSPRDVYFKRGNYRSVGQVFSADAEPDQAPTSGRASVGLKELIAAGKKKAPKANEMFQDPLPLTEDDLAPVFKNYPVSETMKRADLKESTDFTLNSILDVFPHLATLALGLVGQEDYTEDPYKALPTGLGILNSMIQDAMEGATRATNMETFANQVAGALSNLASRKVDAIKSTSVGESKKRYARGHATEQMLNLKSKVEKLINSCSPAANTAINALAEEAGGPTNDKIMRNIEHAINEGRSFSSHETSNFLTSGHPDLNPIQGNPSLDQRMTIANILKQNGDDDDAAAKLVAWMSEHDYKLPLSKEWPAVFGSRGSSKGSAARGSAYKASMKSKYETRSGGKGRFGL